MKNSQEDVLLTFLDQMIAAKGGDQMTKDERIELRNKLRSELETATDKAMIDALPDDKVIELKEKLDAGMDDEQMVEFMTATGIDFDDVVLKAMLKFRRDYLGIDVDNSGIEASVPTQGTVSEVQGDSNVEGVANDTNENSNLTDNTEVA